MAMMWYPKSQDLLQGWIDSILAEASDDLTEWESNFIDSLQGQLTRKGSLSERQEEILERIYAEKTK